MRSATFTIIGILTLGWILATLQPSHWLFGEFFLLAACMVVVRDYVSAREQGLRARATSKSILAGNNAWFTDADDIDGHTRVFHPWDSDRALAKTRRVVTTRIEAPTHSRKQSVEQIAHDMLMHAFRHASS